MLTYKKNGFGRSFCVEGGIYLYPPAALVVADCVCSRPYPQGTCPLAHSVAPPLRKKPSCLWVFYGFTEKRNVLSKYLYDIARHPAGCRGNPYPAGAQAWGQTIDYLYPPATLLMYLRLKAKADWAQPPPLSPYTAPRQKAHAVESTSRFSARKSYIEGWRVGLDNSPLHYSLLHITCS